MKKYALATLLIATGFGAAAVAQEEGAEEGLTVLPPFEAVDANEDGMIDTAESEMLTEVLADQHQIEFQFAAADANRDGVIDGEEYTVYDEVLSEALGIA
jgi:hypothetical protein